MSRVEPNPPEEAPGVRIYMRLRPSDRPAPHKLLRQLSSQTLSLQREDRKHRYRCQQVFPTTISQQQLHEKVAAPAVERLLKGQDALLLVHGYRGSGKRYSLTGDGSGSLMQGGLLQRCLEQLFETLPQQVAPLCLFQPNGLNSFELRRGIELAEARIAEAKRRFLVSLELLEKEKPLKGKMSRSCCVFVSYIELYNNSIFDLLAASSEEPRSLILREDAQQQLYVDGAQELEIRSAAEGWQLFNQGQNHLRRSHALRNAQSNRSHLVFSIRLLQAELVPKGDGFELNMKASQPIKLSHLTLVDLAGSEELARPSQLDKSLTTLTKCLQQLRRGETPSIRESKLTQLLGRDLVKAESVKLLLCLNPADECFGQNLQVLQLAELLEQPKANLAEKDTLNLIKLKDLKGLIGQQRLQRSQLSEKQKNLRAAIVAINEANQQLSTDNAALLGAYDQQKEVTKNLSVKLSKHSDFVEQLVHNMAQARRDNDELRKKISAHDKLIAVLKADLVLAKQRRRCQRESLERRMRDVDSFYARQSTELKVQLQLKQEQLDMIKSGKAEAKQGKPLTQIEMTETELNKAEAVKDHKPVKHTITHNSKDLISKLIQCSLDDRISPAASKSSSSDSLAKHYNYISGSLERLTHSNNLKPSPDDSSNRGV